MTLSAAQFSSAQIATAKTIYESLVAYGTYFAVAGVVNAFAESSFRADIEGDEDKSFGLWQVQQWQTIRDATKIDIRTAGIEDQCTTVLWLMQNTEKAAMRGILAATSYEDATRAWCSAFERPGAPDQADLRVADVPVFLEILGLTG